MGNKAHFKEVYMTIYTHGYIKVKLTEARIVNVWAVQHNGAIKWHYTEPKKVPKKAEITKMHVWHMKGIYDDSEKAGNLNGKPMRDGEEMDINNFRADGGLREVVDECHRLNPAHAAWEKEIYGYESIDDTQATA
jgi:hypothetical protein